MDPLYKLASLFERFPGIGPRQARRFVYFLLTQNKDYIQKLTEEIKLLEKDITQCSKCMRYFTDKSNQKTCEICLDKNRMTQRLMIISRDEDLENIEKTSAFNGIYFVLGGVVPILEKNPKTRIRIQSLLGYIESKAKNKDLEEVILAMNANPEGENTSDYIKEELGQLKETYGFKITILGRGLSTGTEIEYSDKETIRNALEHRITAD